MSGRRLMFLLLLGGVAIGICFANPRLRAGIGGCAESVREEVTPGTGTDTIEGDVKVFVIRGGQYYHVRGCPRLEGEIGVPTALVKARELFEPCPDCNPPE